LRGDFVFAMVYYVLHTQECFIKTESK
jgi:hypothetical protein